jgi:hypothetical protein
MIGSTKIECLDNMISLSLNLEEFHSILKIIIRYVQVEMVIGNYGEYKRILSSLCLLSKSPRIIFSLIMLGLKMIK